MPKPEESSDEGTSSSSEEEEPYIDETSDKQFFKTLSCLKNKDPKIYDPTVVFFPEEDNGTGETSKKTNKKQDSKPVYLRDYERDMVVKEMDNIKREDSDGEDDADLPYAVQQKSLKASFKAAIEDSESEEDLLTVKQKTVQDREKEEEEYTTWLKGNKEELSDEETKKDLKPLHDYWNKPGLDPNEQFLKDYILNKRYLEEGEDAEDDGVSEDGDLLEMQEEFETQYNMRFENDTNTEVKRYPRVVEGSLRRKDESRKLKRKERKTRKRLEKEKKKDEIAQVQKQKLQEFKDQVEKIKQLTGNDQLGFRDEEIFGDEDFNPEEYDKKMQALYSDAFYSVGGDEEKPNFELEGDVDGWEDAEITGNFEGDPDNMDLDAPHSSGTGKKKESRSKKKRKEKKKAFTDILDVAKPVFDPVVHNSYQKYIDEYYDMDCEDFIDDIPCKFKYRDVVANDYGLSIDEMLTAEDKELNQWVSAKKITKLRPEHVERNEVKIYKKKGYDFNLKKKILASLYGSPKRNDEDNDEVQDNENPKIEDLSTVSKANKKMKRPLSEETTLQDSQQDVPSKKRKKNKGTVENPQTPNNVIVQHTGKPQNQKDNLKKKKHLRKGKNNKRQNADNPKNADPMSAVSDLRLKAYDIKPKEFKKKLKFKK